MNYCIVAFGVILLVAGTTWLLDGRKHYKGPAVGVMGLIAGQIDGKEVSVQCDSDGVIEDEGKEL